MNYKYEIIIYWSEVDNCFLAEVPELPGCISDGQTQEDAVKNIKAIIEDWVETAKEIGRAIPKSKGKLMYA